MLCMLSSVGRDDREGPPRRHMQIWAGGAHKLVARESENETKYFITAKNRFHMKNIAVFR